MAPAPVDHLATTRLAPWYAARMTESVPAPGSPAKPTVPDRAPRLAWGIVAATILGLLLACAILVLIATWCGS
jgi:hypothetical protein